jgi:hypothetical protein
MATKRIFKTSKRVSGGNSIYRSWDKWKEGDVLIATYKGEGPQDKYRHPTFQFEVIETFFADKKAGREITNKVVTLNHTGGFGKSMQAVEEGDTVQITYNGQNEITKGEWKGEMAHAIEVEVGDIDGEGDDSTDEEEVEEDDGSDDL